VYLGNDIIVEEREKDKGLKEERGVIMSKIVIDYGGTEDIIPLLEDALAREREILHLAIEQTKAKLAEFEKKYGLASGEFYNSPQRDDLAEEHEEYFRWLTEIEALEFLERRKKSLEGVTICS
jgi:hypothetical protein